MKNYFFGFLDNEKVRNPPKYAHLFIKEDEIDMKKLEDLEHEHIAQWYINETEKKVVIKYAADKIDEEELKSFIK